MARQRVTLTESHRLHFHRVNSLRPLWLLLLCAQFSSAQTTFTKPSEAYEYARRPLTEWKTAIREHRKPATPTIRPDIVQDRGKALCPSFSLDSASGEELYWLAKLCEEDNGKATIEVERYLAEEVRFSHHYPLCPIAAIGHNRRDLLGLIWLSLCV